MSSTKTISLLSEPAIYFPISGDRYSTRASLTKFGHDFGNPQHNQHLFQFDNQFTHYRKNKLSIRKNSLQDYVCADTANLTALSSAAQFILQHLCYEHSNYFSLQQSSQGSDLNCLLTDEQLHIDHMGNHLFDALALQLQEDLCVIQIKPTETDNNLWMRIERQVIWPIPHTHLILFTIRTYFRDVDTLEEKQCIRLKNAVNSMSDATLEYKNIDKEDVIRKLKNKINRP